MSYIEPEVIVLNNEDLKEIAALANSGGFGCSFSGACTGGPANPCSTLDAWH